MSGKINAKQLSGIVDYTQGGTNNSTFSSDRFIVFGTNSIVSSSYSVNNLGTSSTDIWSARQVLDNVITLTLTGARSANSVTNTYLRGDDGLPFNTTPFILPFNGTIKFISLSTGANSSWSGEVRNNGTLITGASLVSTAQTATFSSYNINVDAGARLQLYCNGTGVNNPRMSVIITKR